MSELGIIVQAMLPVVAIAGLGAALRRIHWLTVSADASLLALTVNLLTPCLILDKVLGSSALEHAGTLLLAPLAGFTAVVLSILFCLALAARLGLASQATRRSFAVATGLQNYGYFPLPLALSLYGKDTAAVLFVHNLGVEVALWTVGVAVLAAVPLREIRKRLLSPPLVAIVLALLVNLTLGRAAIPSFALQTLSLLGAAAIPLGLLLTGATMVDQAPKFWGRGSVRVLLASCVLRLGVLPLVYFAGLWLLPAELELKRVFVLQAAMPAAVFPIVLTKHYGGDSATALRVVFATTVASLVTLPLWVHFGSSWLLTH